MELMADSLARMCRPCLQRCDRWSELAELQSDVERILGYAEALHQVGQEDGRWWMPQWLQGCELAACLLGRTVVPMVAIQPETFPLPADAPDSVLRSVGSWGRLSAGLRLLGHPQLLAIAEAVNGPDFTHLEAQTGDDYQGPAIWIVSPGNLPSTHLLVPALLVPTLSKRVLFEYSFCACVHSNHIERMSVLASGIGTVQHQDGTTKLAVTAAVVTTDSTSVKSSDALPRMEVDSSWFTQMGAY